MNRDIKGRFIKGHKITRKGTKQPVWFSEFIRKVHLGKIVSDETRMKQSLALKGKNIGNKNGLGKRSDKFRKECSNRMKIKLSNIDNRLKILEALEKAHIACRGKKRPEWVKEKIRKTILSQRGNPDREYGEIFNKQLKEKIRVRDNFICQLCGVPELECNHRLSIHHIDYNKKNCNENNLLTLCQGCNSKVNFNRNLWKMWFQENWYKEVQNTANLERR